MFKHFSVDLRTVAVADQAIIIDNTAPISGQVLDGPVQGIDLNYTKNFLTVSLK